MMGATPQVAHYEFFFNQEVLGVLGNIVAKEFGKQKERATS